MEQKINKTTVKTMRLKDGAEVPFTVRSRKTEQFKGTEIISVDCTTPRVAHPMSMDMTRELLGSKVTLGEVRHRITEDSDEAVSALLEGKSDLAIVPSPIPVELIEGTAISVLTTIEPVETNMRYVKKHHVLGFEPNQG